MALISGAGAALAGLGGRGTESSSFGRTSSRYPNRDISKEPRQISMPSMTALSAILTLLCVMVVASAAALAIPEKASANWCWQKPEPCSFGYLSFNTTNTNGCWYSAGEVCSGWAYWYEQDFYRNYAPIYIAKTLYGYENSAHIRGLWSTGNCSPCIVLPSDVGLGGYLKAQDSWWGSGVGEQSYIQPNAYN